MCQRHPRCAGHGARRQPAAGGRAGRQLAVAPGVRIHSIIGIKDRAHPERGDGAVSLESASWPQGSTHLVDGEHDLLLATFACDLVGQPTIGFNASTTVKRSGFGLGLYVPGVSDDVQIRITTEASVPLVE